MYDGIFEDLIKVKAILAKHGHKKIDENYIFEQLEISKSVDVLVEQVLRDKSRYPDSGFQDHLEDANSSNDMSSSRITDRACQSQGNNTTSLEVQNYTSTFNTGLLDSTADIVDLTNEYRETNRMLLSKNEDYLDLTHSESDVEIDNYYDADPWGLEGDTYDKIDSPPLLSLSQLRGITSSPNPNHRDQQTDGQADIRTEEILEENNNDPNNNLDNIQILEQNRSSAYSRESSPEVLLQKRSHSPKPGCSKDYNIAPKSYCSGKFSEIADEADKIVELIPRLKYPEVVSTLMKHENDDNRVEEALLELLQKHTLDTPVSSLIKRRQVIDICPSEPKKVCPSTALWTEEQTVSNNNSLSAKLMLKVKNMDGNFLMEACDEDPTLKNAPVIDKASIESTSKWIISEQPEPTVKPGTSDEPHQTTYSLPAVKSETSKKPDQSTVPPPAVKPTDSTEIAIVPSTSKEPAQGAHPTPVVKAGTFEKPAVKPAVPEEAIPAVTPSYRLSAPSVNPRTTIQPENAIKLGTSKKPAPSVKSGTVKQPDQSAHPTPVVKPQPSLKPYESTIPAKLGTCKKAGHSIENPKPRWDTRFHEAPKNVAKAKTVSNNPTVTKSSIVKPAKLQLPKSTLPQPGEMQTKPLLRPARLNITNTKWPTKEKSLKTLMNLGPATHSQAGKRSLPAEPKVVHAKDYQTVNLGVRPATQTSGVLPAVKTNSSGLPAAQTSGSVLPTAKSSGSVLSATQTSGSVPSVAKNSNSILPTAQTDVRPNVKTLGMYISQLKSMLPSNMTTRYEGPMIDWNTVNVPSKTFKVGNILDTLGENLREPTTSKTEIGGTLKALNVGPGVPGTSSSSSKSAVYENIEKNAELQIEIPLTKEPPRELYYPLRSIFPDVDPSYVAKQCINNQHLGLEALVDKLLESRERHLIVINPEPEPEPLESSVDDQYDNLVGIFPNADPMYLRAFAERNYNKPEAIKQFVQAKLESHDYPTKEDYLKKIKITEQQRQYTTEFNVQQFLNIFPDPFGHFENPARTNKYNFPAIEFLKAHFNKIKVVTIGKVYNHHAYNMSLAARELEIIRQDMKSKRCATEIPTEDIPLLQEMAFIRNKKIIKEYIEKQKAIEEKEFNKLKKNNQLLECQCCFNEECMPSKCSICSDGHIFCNTCIVAGTESKIGEGQSQFPCFTDCQGEFTLPILQKVLKPTIFSILIQKRQEAEVMAAGLEGLVSCPFCHFASIPPSEDKIFKCFNPECMKESCRLCKELSHVPLKCDEVIKGEEARKYLEEKMTNALVRTCYKCHRPFFKEEGCNKMTCPCGAIMCYICGQPVEGYKHFNAQGSERHDLCPLWSDNKRLNAQTVREVAHAAQKEILSKNPNLEIDATALLPNMPAASKGPHDDIPNGNMLPLHVQRPGGRIPQ